MWRCTGLRRGGRPRHVTKRNSPARSSALVVAPPSSAPQHSEPQPLDPERIFDTKGIDQGRNRSLSILKQEDDILFFLFLTFIAKQRRSFGISLFVVLHSGLGQRKNKCISYRSQRQALVGSCLLPSPTIPGRHAIRLSPSRSEK